MRTPTLFIVRGCCTIAILSAILTASAATWQNDSAERLTKAWLFEQPLLWTGQTRPGDSQNAELLAIAAQRGASKPEEIVQKFETFLASHPQSPWAASLHANIGYYDRQRGYYTRALNHWEQAWTLTKSAKAGSAKQIADFTFAHWTSLLASLGRTDLLKSLFQETVDRKFENGPLQQIVNGTREGLQAMCVKPGACFRCGTFALHQLAKALHKENVTKEIDQAPSPVEGFSMGQLVNLASRAGINLVAVRRRQNQFVVPSVVHWKQNHYAAIVEAKGSLYRVVDPTFGNNYDSI